MDKLYSSTVVAILLNLGVIMATLGLTGAQVGVCYGMLGNNLPSKQQVVALYNQHGIKKMRIYDLNLEILEALRGSNIELIIGVPNADLQRVASNQAEANTWVQKYVKNYGNVQFRHIAVGNEVTPFNGGTSQYAQYLLPAIRNIQNAINSAGLAGRICVSTSFGTDILGVVYPPSKGAFRSDIGYFINPIISHLLSTQAPLLLNLYPYNAYVSTPSISLEYALFTSPSAVVSDPPYQYQNLFDAQLDTIYAALDRAVGTMYTELDRPSGGKVSVTVSESGWPTAGHKPADNSFNDAQTYNQNLIRHVKGGTPRRPGIPIETYIFAMFDENLKGSTLEQSWGLFMPNGQPKYPINFA